MNFENWFKNLNRKFRVWHLIWCFVCLIRFNLFQSYDKQRQQCPWAVYDGTIRIELNPWAIYGSLRDLKREWLSQKLEYYHTNCIVDFWPLALFIVDPFINVNITVYIAATKLSVVSIWTRPSIKTLSIRYQHYSAAVVNYGEEEFRWFEFSESTGRQCELTPQLVQTVQICWRR